MVIPIIEVNGISKKYRLGQKESYYSLRESFVKSIKKPFEIFFKKPDSSLKTQEEFWALQDISFTVNTGEVLGLIGRNGAGKTTLLKILSRITYPTFGEIKLKGRVASLLEVGTGFHPELTGRENIYFNGSILGMKKKEIDKKFDEIVAFSEIEKFIDTPVKRYSSGMYLRLAFSVAAHLEPEILLIDEVLAVGDAAFQKKCIGKMKDVSGQGRTVIFVSHDMSAVETLCKSAVLIDHGKKIKEGPVQNVVTEYLKGLNFPTYNDLQDSSISRKGNGLGRFTKIELLDMAGNKILSVVEGRPFIVALKMSIKTKIDTKIISITFIDQRGKDLLTTIHYDSLPVDYIDTGEYAFKITVAPNPFVRGTIGIRLACFGASFIEYDHIHYAFSFTVTQNPESKDILHQRPGAINIPLTWEMRKL